VKAASLSMSAASRQQCVLPIGWQSCQAITTDEGVRKTEEKKRRKA
jgi:hypothetical protein